MLDLIIGFLAYVRTQHSSWEGTVLNHGNKMGTNNLYAQSVLQSVNKFIELKSNCLSSLNKT